VHFEGLNLQAVIVFLVAAGVVVPLLKRSRISPVLGFLVVGLVIGPHGLARFTDTFPFISHLVIADLEGVRALAELGVIFLLFMIGLELSLDRLWALRRMVFGLGGAQVLITGAVIAFIAAAFGNSVEVAVILGGGFALSSTAIVMQMLSENRRMGTPVGRTGFSILLFQDLAVLPILFMVSAFAAQGDSSPVLSFALAMGQAIIAVGIILGLGRLVIRPLFRLIGSAASREMFLAFVLLIIIGISLATEAAGLSLSLGAFLAGLLFAETEYRHEIEVDIEPFKGLLLGLFFVSVGMSVDLAQIVARPVWLAASVVGLFVLKGVILFLLVRAFRESRIVAMEVALLLGQGGEFAFLVVGLATALGLMPDPTAQFMLIVTSITMFITPFVAGVARRLAKNLEDRQGAGNAEQQIEAATLEGHVIIIGYGRVGRMLASVLESQEIPHVALDIDTSLVQRFGVRGAGVYFGDGSRADMLRKLHIETASSMVVTINRPEAAERIVAEARKNWPLLQIYARAHDVDHAARLIARGANHVIPEATEASLQMSEMVLINAGLPDRAAHHLIEEKRLEEQVKVDDAQAPGS